MSAGLSENRRRSVAIRFAILFSLAGIGGLCICHIGNSDVLPDAVDTTAAHHQASKPDVNQNHTAVSSSDIAIGYPKVEPNIKHDAKSKPLIKGEYELRLPTGPVTDASSERFGVTQDVQSPARPFGLDIIAPVQAAGSDASGKDFSDNVLPDLLDYIESNFVHSTTVEQDSIEADSNKLFLEYPADVRVYFVGEEAAYHNSLGLHYADDAGPMLIFPDASTMYSYHLDEDTQRETTSEDCPLIPGDFVDIGSAEAGSILDFFIIPRGADEGSEVYGIDKEFNEDQTSHTQILGFAGDSMIVIGFEDIKYGGDRDYEDVVIAVEIGEENLRAIADRLGF